MRDMTDLILGVRLYYPCSPKRLPTSFMCWIRGLTSDNPFEYLISMRITIIAAIAAFVLIAPAKSIGQQSTINPADFSKPIDQLPPSPDAWALGKFGGAAPAMSTGAVSVSLPLYEYHSTQLSLPISLSYSSNGFRVDELATRVGTGWNLVAAGVITRTIRGANDLLAERLTAPNFASHDATLLQFLKNASETDLQQWDTQPDEFSFNFNGVSGQFILDSNGSPVLLTHSNVKIATNFNNSAWDIKITDGSGIQYFFGGDAAREMTRRISAGQNCGKTYGTATPTAYYLTKILHPAGDEIDIAYTARTIDYITGISETLFASDPDNFTYSPCSGDRVVCTNLDNSNCQSWMRTNATMVQSISSTGGVTVNFKYIDRDDSNDRLLARIEVVDPATSQKIKTFKLDYQNVTASENYQNSYSVNDATLMVRPFLIQVTEQASDSTSAKKHAFYYNDIQSLPPRLSFAQDVYGFFNGQQNTCLAPRPTTPSWRRYLPGATANRSPDYQFASKGLLTRIVYPTGGEDEFEYNGIFAHGVTTTEPPQRSEQVGVTNTRPGGAGTTITHTIVVQFAQEVNLTASWSFDAENSDGALYDPNHDKAVFDFYNAASPGTWSDEYTRFQLTNVQITADHSIDEIVPLSPGTYVFSLKVLGHSTGVGQVTYSAGFPSSESADSEVGGVVVDRVTTTDPNSGTSQTKRFFYKTFPDLDQSSATIVRFPVLEQYYSVSVPCNFVSGETISFQDCGISSCHYYAAYSNSKTNLYLTGSSPVIFSTVVESFGDNFENGGIEHQFEVAPDDPGNPLVGSYILGSQQTSNAWKNGREIYTNYFRKSGNDFKSVRTQSTHYLEDSRVQSDVAAYIVNKKYEPKCQTLPPQLPSEDELNAFDCTMYNYLQRWMYPDAVTTTEFDDQGVATLVHTTITEYGNVAHAMPTRITNTGSDASIESFELSYPQDLSLTGTAEAARLALISLNNVSPVLKQRQLKNGVPTITVSTDYQMFSNNLVVPKTHYTQTGTGTTEARVDFTNYTLSGKLAEESKTGDTKQSYIWGYADMYPIAQAVNATLADVHYTSFEQNSKGYWSYSGPTTKPFSTFVPTGREYYSLSGGSITGAATSSTTYTLSFWYKGSAPTVTAGTQAGLTSRPGQDGWIFSTRTITGTSLVTISGTDLIDEVRLYPMSAQMTSYTFDPTIGMTSASDPNGVTTYYEYDTFGRLKTVRDYSGQILKNYSYKYVTE